MSIETIFNSSIRISDMDPLAAEAVFPHGIELCLTRVPIRKRDGFDPKKLRLLLKKIKANMVQNGVMFLICYAPTEAKARPFELAKIATDEGFTHVDNIVVEKSWLPGKRSEINLVNSHEYVFHFCNGKVWNLDRLPIKEYLKSDPDTSCPGNTWKIETGSLDEAYPLDLANLLIRMADILPGSIVFDPYMGTANGFLAAHKMGHSFYGFESNSRKMKSYQKMINELKSNDKQV